MDRYEKIKAENPDFLKDKKEAEQKILKILKDLDGRYSNIKIDGVIVIMRDSIKDVNIGYNINGVVNYYK